MFNGFWRQVLRAIEFDDQFSRKANKINDVRTDRGLASERCSELARLQEPPQALFGWRRIVA
jgi:hypothetical protein